MRLVISFGLAKKRAHAHRSQHSLHWTKLEIICGLAQTLVLLSSIRMIRRLSFIRRFGVFFLLDSFSLENFSMLIVTDGIFILSNSFALLYGY